MTQDVYMGRRAVDPSLAEALGQFGPEDPAADLTS